MDGQVRMEEVYRMGDMGGAIVLLIFGVGLIGEGLQRRNGGVS